MASEYQKLAHAWFGDIIPQTVIMCVNVNSLALDYENVHTVRLNPTLIYILSKRV